MNDVDHARAWPFDWRARRGGGLWRLAAAACCAAASSGSWLGCCPRDLRPRVVVLDLRAAQHGRREAGLLRRRAPASRPESYGPGLHFIVAGVERLHLFPHDLQVINFSDSSSEISQQVRAAPTRSRSRPATATTCSSTSRVLYRIEDAYKVFTEAGPGRAFEDRLVIPRADRDPAQDAGRAEQRGVLPGAAAHREGARRRTISSRAELAPYGIARRRRCWCARYVYDEQLPAAHRGAQDQGPDGVPAPGRGQGGHRAAQARHRSSPRARPARRRSCRAGRPRCRSCAPQADLYERKQAAEGKLLVELAEAKGTRAGERGARRARAARTWSGSRWRTCCEGVKVMVLPSDGKDGTNPLDLGDAAAASSR